MMSGELYFRGGELPWLGCSASVLAVGHVPLRRPLEDIAHQDF